MRDSNLTIPFLISFISFLIIIVFSLIPLSFSDNYDNTTVITQLNITNTPPEVVYVQVDDSDPTGNSITLIDNSYVTVTCNATINDTQGWGDITAVNATFYDTLRANSSALDDENYHYTNTSCNWTGGSGTELNVTCTFQVAYYANNGTWNCNVTAYDLSSTTGSGIDLTPPIINELYALEINNVLDYGNMSVGTVSQDTQFNVTNTGNMKINITVDGWGVNNGDLLAMNCTIGNISISSERYAISPGITYSSMYNLSDDVTAIPGLTVAQRTGQISFNTTYWKIQVPIGVSGWCNGSIVFTATEGGA